MFKRVYSHCLDKTKNWYAYNKLLFGYQKNRGPEGCKTFQCFPTEVKRVKLAELRDDDGRQVSYRYFFAGSRKSIEYVFVISTLGIVVLSLRHETEGWLNTNLGRHMGRIINSVLLENISETHTDKAVQEAPEKNKSLLRAEGHISLLNEKIAEQESLIKCFQAHRENLDNASTRHVNITSMSPATPYNEISMSALLSMNEITPPEKKRHIKEKGRHFTIALQNIADEHREDVFQVLGNMAVHGDPVSSKVITGATDIIFSTLGAKKAFETVLSERSRFLLMESIRVPEWVYVLLNVRIRISDSSWRTLLNLTQLGRTGVSL